MKVFRQYSLLALTKGFSSLVSLFLIFFIYDSLPPNLSSVFFIAHGVSLFISLAATSGLSFVIVSNCHRFAKNIPLFGGVISTIFIYFILFIPLYLYLINAIFDITLYHFIKFYLSSFVLSLLLLLNFYFVYFRKPQVGILISTIVPNVSLLTLFYSSTLVERMDVIDLLFISSLFSLFICFIFLFFHRKAFDFSFNIEIVPVFTSIFKNGPIGLLNILILQMPILVMGVYLDDQGVADFTLAYRLSSFIFVVISVFSLVNNPRIASFYNSRMMSNFKREVFFGCVLSFVFSLASSVVIFLLFPWLKTFLSGSNLSISLLVIMLLGVCIKSMSANLCFTFQVLKKLRFILFTQVLTLLAFFGYPEFLGRKVEPFDLGCALFLAYSINSICYIIKFRYRDAVKEY
ncbi:lipopolysaccharide biosynthesis protein [Shewanella algae]|uniref:lipopolysaccharide biosynthesis protein n=1 Tax=Shewanella algae TaxID=38313 RepID=UPI001AACCA9B|nr:hypothetical protein [Shewanella algae]MBO2623907.1 hypothetical protein [Shewanella algae]MBO2700059.1 hypothetical protein [Shewanella algae]